MWGWWASDSNSAKTFARALWRLSHPRLIPHNPCQSSTLVYVTALNRKHNKSRSFWKINNLTQKNAEMEQTNLVLQWATNNKLNKYKMTGPRAPFLFFSGAAKKLLERSRLRHSAAGPRSEKLRHRNAEPEAERPTQAPHTTVTNSQRDSAVEPNWERSAGVWHYGSSMIAPRQSRGADIAIQPAPPARALAATTEAGKSRRWSGLRIYSGCISWAMASSS